MRLESLAVTVRPRSGWQAMDLGFQIARQWWRPIWAAWCAVYLPVALLVYLLLHEELWIASALLWWLKPLFDRAVMHVASQAVFGAPPPLRETLRDAGKWLRLGLFGALLWRRFDFARTMMLPVVQLEGQRGRDARARRKVLGKRMRGYAVWLTVVCAHFEWVLLYGLGLIQLLLVPGSDYADSEWGGLFKKVADNWGWSEALYYTLAVSVIEPFYVCAGFSLYLNRRATLEGWDIELALRRLGERLRRMAATAATAFALVLAIALPQPAEAQALTPKEAAAEVLKHPDFQEYREGERWVYQGNPDEPSRPWLADFARRMSEILQGLAWVGAGLLVALLIYAALRMRGEGGTDTAGYAPPDALFGMDVRPETLPEDIAGTAARLAAEGRIREAMSLLYRGALSRLIHAHAVRLVAGDTEKDCVRRAARALDAPALRYFAHLVEVWARTAYARKPPHLPEVQALCADWTRHFAPRGEAA